MVEKIQNIGVTLPAQNIAPAKEPEKHDNKESNDFVKKHATELGIGAVAVAAAVIGGIIYAKKGKGDDVIKDLTKNNDLLPAGKGKSKTEPVKAPDVEQPATATTGGVPESKPTGSTNPTTNNNNSKGNPTGTAQTETANPAKANPEPTSTVTTSNSGTGAHQSEVKQTETSKQVTPKSGGQNADEVGKGEKPPTNIEQDASKVESKVQTQLNQNGSQVEKQGSQVESKPAGESNSATKLMGRAPNEAEKALIDAAPSKDEITAKLAQVQKQLDKYPFMKGKPMTFDDAGGKPGQIFVEIKNDKGQLVKKIFEGDNISHYEPESGKLLYEECFKNGARSSIRDYTTNENIFLQNGQIDFVNKYKSHNRDSFSDELYCICQQDVNFYTKYEGKAETTYWLDENWTNTRITQQDADGKKLLEISLHPDGSIK